MKMTIRIKCQLSLMTQLVIEVGGDFEMKCRRATRYDAHFNLLAQGEINYRTRV